MDQTAGKVFAREYFYNNYLASLMTPRQLRSSNLLTLLGEDFREIGLIEELGIPPYRVFSVEKDHAIYQRQLAFNREADLGTVLYYGGLADYVHTHLRHHEISIFNLDICGSYLKAVDPVLGELLLHVRRMSQTVVATYSSAGRDRPQLMEGLKSLFVLLWLAPDAIDKLVRHFYSQYRSVLPSESEKGWREASKNMLLRHMFWLRSHMEHVMAGASSLGVSSYDAVSVALREQDEVWRRFVDQAEFPLTYGAMLATIEKLPRPSGDDVRMDLEFLDVELLTYAANNGFYHNCYFATYESNTGAVSLSTWLVESSKSLRQHPLVVVGLEGRPCPSSHGRIAVDTDSAVLWGKNDISQNLRHIALSPPADIEEVRLCPETREVDEIDRLDTVGKIRQLARENPTMSAREIAKRLSLQLPLQQVIAQVAVARRK